MGVKPCDAYLTFTIKHLVSPNNPNAGVLESLLVIILDTILHTQKPDLTKKMRFFQSAHYKQSLSAAFIDICSKSHLIINIVSPVVYQSTFLFMLYIGLLIDLS